MKILIIAAMTAENSGEKPSRRGPNYEKNRRPATSTRATFAFGLESLEQTDRLAKILSNYKEGDVSRSAVLRCLLKIAEDAALRSGDGMVAAVLGARRIPKSGKLPKIQDPDSKSIMIWKRICSEIEES